MYLVERLCPLPYWWPTPSVVQPPMASIISAGHSTARNRSLRLCRNEWVTHPSGTRGFNHLFNAALAELALHLVSLHYFGEANWWARFTARFAAQSEAPTSRICFHPPHSNNVGLCMYLWLFVRTFSNQRKQNLIWISRRRELGNSQQYLAFRDIHRFIPSP